MSEIPSSGPAVVVCSILEPTPEATGERIASAPAGCALIEIRGDHLRVDDLAGLVRRTGREVVVTVRSARDGGGHVGSEAERRAALLGALAAGARYVDVEADGALADMAHGPERARVILSQHGTDCAIAPLRAVYRRLAAAPAAVLKIVPRCDSVAQAEAVRGLLAERPTKSQPLACFAMGRAGTLTRILAPAWGSWATYGSAAVGRETAGGQITAQDLLEVHDVLGIRRATRRFAIVGSAVAGSPSPAMHRAGFLAAGLDARYLPIEIERFDECLPLVGAEGIAGLEALAVTMPYKEIAAARCARLDVVAARAGAVNTVLVGSGSWSGFNTDGPAIADLVCAQLDPRGCRAAVVGAGGTARAAAAVLVEAGAQVTLYNRDLARAQAAAAAVGASARPLARLAAEPWDVLVQATPLGKHGERLIDAHCLRGRFVLDAVYGARTPLIADAAARGIPTADGLDLLVTQGLRQFELMTGQTPDAGAMRRAARQWLVARGAAPAVDGAAPSE